MRWAIAVIILALAANWLFGLNKIDGDTGRPTVCAEDACPVWDCYTMGNRICGP